MHACAARHHGSSGRFGSIVIFIGWIGIASARHHLTYQKELRSGGGWRLRTACGYALARIAGTKPHSRAFGEKMVRSPPGSHAVRMIMFVAAKLEAQKEPRCG